MWGWLLAIAAAIAAAAAKASSPSSATNGGDVGPTGNIKGRDAVAATVANLGLGEPWISWAIWTAKGESGWSTGAWLGRPKDDGSFSPGALNERKAAADTLTRLVGEGRWPCADNPAKYGIGSGGWFGQLAPLTTYFLADIGAPASVYCEPQAAWKDPRASTLAHFRQVRGTVNILRSKMGEGGTFLMLRALYGLPSRDPNKVDTPERRAQYTKTLEKAGIDPSFLDQRVPSLPGLTW